MPLNAVRSRILAASIVLLGAGVPSVRGEDPPSVLRSAPISVADDQASGPPPRGDALDLKLQNRSEMPLADRPGDLPATGWMQGPLPTIVGALAVTLGLFCCFVVIARRTHQRGVSKVLPREAVEVLGHTPLGPRQQLWVVRCGAQALVLGSSAAGLQRLAQIDDPDEAAQLIASCRPNGATASFRAAMQDIERQSHAPGFVDRSAPGAPNSPAAPTGGGNRLFLRG